MSIIRKSLAAVSASGLLVLGIATFANPIPRAQQSEPGKQSQQQPLKSVAGKVASIESGGKTFKLTVSGENEKTMDFVLDKNTKVEGQVHEGTAVTVEYQAMENGQNLAVSVTAEA
jgi:hypothetical protein